eukprot:SAG22_NODE_181_length_16048_cov_157.464418_7_plen_129_part_00
MIRETSYGSPLVLSIYEHVNRPALDLVAQRGGRRKIAREGTGGAAGLAFEASKSVPGLGAITSNLDRGSRRRRGAEGDAGGEAGGGGGSLAQAVGGGGSSARVVVAGYGGGSPDVRDFLLGSSSDEED